MSPSPPEFDAIVVGAGPAGCVAASRLSEAGRLTLIIEAGQLGPHPNGDGPAWLVSPTAYPKWFWPRSIERGRRSADDSGQSDYWSGLGVGGGSAVNGMVLQPGARSDYDRWADISGCAGWHGRAMEPWIRKAIAVMQPEVRSEADHDDGSELSTIVRTFDAVVRGAGHRGGGTSLDGEQAGVLSPALATKGGRRRTAAEAYLGPDRRPELTMECGRGVRRLLVNRGQVVGVQLDDGSSRRAPLVVLAAGSIGTPLLLHRSGLGAGAGAFLKNHPSVTIGFGWPTGDATSTDIKPGVHRVLRWSPSASGESAPGQSGALELTAFLMGPFPGPAGPTGALLVMLSVVRSEGRLVFGAHQPEVVSNRLSDGDDRLILTNGVRHVVSWGSDFVSELGSGPLTVGDQATSATELVRMTDREVGQWLRQHPGATYHAAGTCRMGPSNAAGSVTASDGGAAGTLLGALGAVVVDASLFPDLVSGGLQLPVMAVAERIVAETVLSAA